MWMDQDCQCSFQCWTQTHSAQSVHTDSVWATFLPIDHLSSDPWSFTRSFARQGSFPSKPTSVPCGIFILNVLVNVISPVGSDSQVIQIRSCIESGMTPHFIWAELEHTWKSDHLSSPCARGWACRAETSNSMSLVEPDLNMLTLGTRCFQTIQINQRLRWQIGILSSAVASPEGHQPIFWCRNSRATSGGSVSDRLALPQKLQGTATIQTVLRFAGMLTPELLFSSPWWSTDTPQDLWEICRLHTMTLWAIFLTPSFWGSYNTSFKTDGIPHSKAHHIGQQAQAMVLCPAVAMSTGLANCTETLAHKTTQMQSRSLWLWIFPITHW